MSTIFGALPPACALPALVPLVRNRRTPAGWAAHHLVEASTVLPTFYRNVPTGVSPLTRQHWVDPRMAERWDVVALGAELGTAYSELVDPVEQRRPLTAQSQLAAHCDPDATEIDEDFLPALEYAMPPTAGLGMGADRVVMAPTGRSIRESVLFPLVTPLGNAR